MKKVTIPTCANPFVVIVNGIKYTYPAGETVEVPDDVAAVIEQHHDAHNNPAPAPVVPPFVPSEGVPIVELTSKLDRTGTTLTETEGEKLTAAVMHAIKRGTLVGIRFTTGMTYLCQVVYKFVDGEVESIAVCFLHSTNFHYFVKKSADSEWLYTMQRATMS